VTAVTVDFWWTLFHDPSPGVDRHKARRLDEFEAILRAAGEPASPDALERAYEASGVYLADVWRTLRDVPVGAHVAALLDAIDPGLARRLDGSVTEALAAAYARPALVDPPVVDPGALAALETLCARGCTLAVVSNAMRTPGTVLRALLERHGLLGCFKHTVFSDEVGVRKPDPAIFAQALAALGADREHAVHVGDDAILDVQGARAAGMRVVQVIGDRPGPSGPPRPDAVIRWLAELPEAVARLGRG
jgi:HAD superfamily hydrolase (TIGR01509 family)